MRPRVFARRARAGVVVVDDLTAPAADPRLPSAGRKRSGFGVTRGAEGFLELAAVKAIGIRHGQWYPHFAPPNPADSELCRTHIEWSQGGTWGVWFVTRDDETSAASLSDAKKDDR